MAKGKIELTKLFYSISEVAELLEISESNIRFWGKEFEDILKPQRSSKGNRQFQQKDIETLKSIKYLLKDCGMTIEGAKRRLAKNRGEVENTIEIVGRLENIKHILEGMVEEL